MVWDLLTPGRGPGGTPRAEPPGHRPGVSPPVLIVCADDASAAEWAEAAPADRRVHAVTGLARTARILKEGSVEVLAGAVKDLTALVARAVLKLEAVSTVVIAWPEALVAGEHAGALDALLGDAHDARRIVLSWNPAALGDFLERHARRALIVGSAPVDHTGAPLGPIGPARYAIVPPLRRSVAVRDVLDTLNAKHPFIWRGGGLEPPVEAPDAVLCTRLPTRQQFQALAQLGEPVVFLTAAQLPYLRSIATPLTPVRLPSAADRAQDRAEALCERVTRILDEGNVDAELALLDPLFERFDPAEVAAALLAMSRQPTAVSGGVPTVGQQPPAWVKVFVTVGKKDRAAPKDLVGALIREVGIEKGDIGRIDVRDTVSLVDVVPGVADKVVRGLTGISIKGRRVLARLARET